MGNEFYTEGYYESIGRGIMEGIDVIYDHYKETVSLQEKMIHVRNKFFIYSILATIIFCVWGMNPQEMFEHVKSYVQNKYGVKLELHYYYVQSFLWIIYVYLLSRYYQAVFGIERQYKYIKNLESKISNEIEYVNFDRESGAYFNLYPWSLNVIHFFYNIAVPFAILLACWMRIYYEFMNSELSLSLLFDAMLVVFVSIIIVNFIYHMRKTI